MSYRPRVLKAAGAGGPRVKPARLLNRFDTSVRRGEVRGRGAFTLVELLVVIGIIALLVSILLPVLANARKSAADMQCASNIRQICSAFLMYANEFKGKFPPNMYDPKYNPIDATKVNWWYDIDRIGRYLPKNKNFSGTGSIYGTVMICPRDEQGGRSYGMNAYASSAVDAPFKSLVFATYWDASSKPAAELMLVGEKWSDFSGAGLYNAGNTIGFSNINAASPTGALGNLPGRRFVGNLNIPHNAAGSRLQGQLTPTEFDPTRHRRRGEGNNYQHFDGRMNIGFADGHVGMVRMKDLGDPQTGKSTFLALWSPYDKAFQRQYLP